MVSWSSRSSLVWDRNTTLHYVIAFTSRDESRHIVTCAVRLAASVKATVTILKVIANPQSVGVVAELIATDEPYNLAQDEVQEVVQELLKENIDAKGIVRSVDNVGEGLVSITAELAADAIFLGTRDVESKRSLLCEDDPIADYVINHCPATVVLVRPKKSN